MKKVAKFDCDYGSVSLFKDKNLYRVTLILAGSEDGEISEFASFDDAEDQFVAEIEQLLSSVQEGD